MGDITNTLHLWKMALEFFIYSFTKPKRHPYIDDLHKKFNQVVNHLCNKNWSI